MAKLILDPKMLPDRTVPIPGAKPPVELEGARLFFPEERADEFNRLLRDHWSAA